MNAVEITIPSDHVFERVVRDSALVLARHMGFNEDRSADLQLAVSEAVTNAIEHGNKGHIEVKVGVQFLLQDNRLAIRVVDRGGVLPQLPHGAQPHIEDKFADDTPRGLGLFLIEQLVDGVEMHANDGRTEFTMWFDLKQTPAVAGTKADPTAHEDSR